MRTTEVPFDRALEIRKPPAAVRDAAVRVNDDLELCATIYQQVSGKPSPKTGPVRWSAEEMGHILAIYDRFIAEKGREPGDPRVSPLRS
jgi:hypothetical protein